MELNADCNGARHFAEGAGLAMRKAGFRRLFAGGIFFGACAAILLLTGMAAQAQGAASVTSPDQRLKLEFAIVRNGERTTGGCAIRFAPKG